MNQIDFLAIGDTVIDDFIRLNDVAIKCDAHSDQCEMCLEWGGKIPYESNTVIAGTGNAANAAVCAARLGLSSALCSVVGDDLRGTQCIEALTGEQVDTSLIHRQSGVQTNYHYVLWHEANRTILVHHDAFAYNVPTVKPKWAYLSSVAKDSLPFHHELLKWLSDNPEIKLAFQPGTFQIQFGIEALRAIYGRSEIVFCNKEEAEHILGIDNTDDIKNILQKMKALGPKKVVVTDDVHGAYAIDDNGAMWHVPIYNDIKPPFERTGAGDALSSSITTALALGKPFAEALLWGPINAIKVTHEIGAQKGLISREELEKILTTAPESYKLTKYE